MKNGNRISFSLLATLWVLPLLTARPAQAVPIAYEGFDYDAGADLVGGAGGTGLSGAWTLGGSGANVATNYDVASGSLSYSTLTTSGNRITSGPITTGTNSAGITRSLGTSLGTSGTTAYISFLLRPEGTLNTGVFNGFFGLVLENAADPELFLGKPGGGALADYVLENRGGSGQISTGFDAVVGAVSLLVLRIDFTSGVDLFTLFLNPLLGAPEPLAGTVKNDIDVGTITGLTILSTGAFSIDEIRVGTTFADVTPTTSPPIVAVPEPELASWLLLASGLLLLLRVGPRTPWRSREQPMRCARPAA